MNLSFSELIKSVKTHGKIPNAALKDPKDFKYLGHTQKSLFNQAKSMGQFNYLFDMDAPAPSLNLVSVAYKHDWARPNKSQLESLRSKFKLAHAFIVEEDIGSFEAYAFLFHDKTWPLIKAKQVLENELHDVLSQQTSPVASNFEIQSQNLQLEQTINSKEIKLVFETPPIAQSPLEPPNGRIWLTEDKIEVWAPTQAPDMALSLIHI